MTLCLSHAGLSLFPHRPMLFDEEDERRWQQLEMSKMQ
jgi:hypothetical protein